MVIYLHCRVSYSFVWEILSFFCSDLGGIWQALCRQYAIYLLKIQFVTSRTLCPCRPVGKEILIFSYILVLYCESVKFTYLGSNMTYDLDCSKEIAVRIAKAMEDPSVRNDGWFKQKRTATPRMVRWHWAVVWGNPAGVKPRCPT